jgi:hypothetical protein
LERKNDSLPSLVEIMATCSMSNLKLERLTKISRNTLGKLRKGHAQQMSYVGGKRVYADADPKFRQLAELVAPHDVDGFISAVCQLQGDDRYVSKKRSSVLGPAIRVMVGTRILSEFSIKWRGSMTLKTPSGDTLTISIDDF